MLIQGKTDLQRGYYMDLKILTEKHTRNISIQKDLLEYLTAYLNGVKTNDSKLLASTYYIGKITQFDLRSIELLVSVLDSHRYELNELYDITKKYEIYEFAIVILFEKFKNKDELNENEIIDIYDKYIQYLLSFEQKWPSGIFNMVRLFNLVE
jgi:hypothetical protein